MSKKCQANISDLHNTIFLKIVMCSIRLGWFDISCELIPGYTSEIIKICPLRKFHSDTTWSLSIRLSRKLLPLERIIFGLIVIICENIKFCVFNFSIHPRKYHIKLGIMGKHHDHSQSKSVKEFNICINLYGLYYCQQYYVII